MARSTAPRLSTGSTPGSAMSTALVWRLGSAPNAVLAPEKILLAVLSWAWTSSPMTTSQSDRLMVCSRVACGWPPGSVALAVGPIDDDRPQVIEGAAGAAGGAIGEADGDGLALLEDIHRAPVGRAQLHARLLARLRERAVEAAAAAARDVDVGVEGVHLGLDDVERDARGVAGLVAKAAVGAHVERAPRHRPQALAGRARAGHHLVADRLVGGRR